MYYSFIVFITSEIMMSMYSAYDYGSFSHLCMNVHVCLSVYQSVNPCLFVSYSVQIKEWKVLGQMTKTISCKWVCL